MKRTYACVRLVLDSAWRIGVWRPEAADRVETAKDPLHPGSAAVPGSSVLGSLKAAARLQGRDAELFGGDPDTRTSDPSTWWLLGTVLEGANQIQSRKQTAIDRRRRAAAHQGVRTSEAVNPDSTGAYLDLYLRADSAEVGPLLEVVRSWKPSIGGGVTTGMGRAHVESVTHRTIDLDLKADVLALLRAVGDEDGPDRVARMLREAGQVEPIGNPEIKPMLSVTFHSTEMGLSADEAHRTYGSQWKGILRSRAEFIARSLGHAPCIGESSDGWTGCGHCDLCDAFGSADTGVGAWEFGTSDWSTDHQKVDRKRIAVDRFTGGPRDTALFDVSTVSEVTVCLEVRESRAVAPWIRALLLHCLRDVHDGLVAIGGYGAIGLGTMEAKESWYAGHESVPIGPIDWAALPPVEPITPKEGAE